LFYGKSEELRYQR